MNIFSFYIINNDAPEPWQICYQDSATKIMSGIDKLTGEIFYYETLLLIIVGWVLISAIIKYTKTELSYKYFNHGTLIEILWTCSPAFILIAISFPSFKLLYLMDSIIDSQITIKVLGHQWYWSYEYSDYLDNSGDSISFDSIMIPTDDLEPGQFRLLEVDNRIVLPIHTHIRFICTSSDVIHSFAVPSLGLKIDALPGRLNGISTYVEREGTFYGQCSELCGVYHFGMPIVIEAVRIEKYLEWLNIHLDNTPSS
uniref:Cytochrome c oxidase subunit 2 n=1 Tax=Zancudomyces culisetae TaxID=1213189 RepID=COX2_ZANCU|nr:cytochrome c oxidase subunit 2 [Zancudomyces culisetae]Q3T4C0.1 RecName: Full=Cytochrome c oxidase subunit 2; AltName: Full=Cytochrome c oxidase polypeptide II [Zancudomyces culisetae]AAW49494.1 cytochrome c oxidase subunit 2 [Zancudomyces culisetae]